MVAILGDIGGTNIRLAIWNNGRMSQISYFKTAQYPKVQQALDLFIKQNNLAPEHIVLGVAGPVQNGVVKMTNAAGSLSEKDLERRYKPAKCIMINDFVLKGMGLSALKSTNVEVLHKGIVSGDTKCIIGPGTGLGICPVYGNNAYPSEGGHIKLMPPTTETARLIEILGDITAEDILSGQGLVRLYQEVRQLNAQTAIKCTPEDICALAKSGDKMAIQAYLYFFDFLAEFCKNAALMYKATGGIYITSSILEPEHILCLLKKYQFKKVFERHVKMKNLLKEIPIFWINEKGLAFLGLKNIAKDIYKSK